MREQESIRPARAGGPGTGEAADPGKKRAGGGLKSRLRTLAALHLLLMVYSFSNVFSKLAGGETFLSPRFCLFYGATLALLAVYALGWQQVIRRLPLTTAFAHKAITVVWGILWGLVIFGESWSIGKGLGALLIMAGIVLFSTDAGEEEAKK